MKPYAQMTANRPPSTIAPYCKQGAECEEETGRKTSIVPARVGGWVGGWVGWRVRPFGFSPAGGAAAAASEEHTHEKLLADEGRDRLPVEAHGPEDEERPEA